MIVGGKTGIACSQVEPVTEVDIRNFRFTSRAGLKVPLRRKFVGLFRPDSVAEYRVVSIFTQKTEQETVHPNIF